MLAHAASRCCTHRTDTDRLLLVTDYSWEGISPEARFLWGEEAKAIGDHPIESDDANDLPLARLGKEHGFEVAPDPPMLLFLPVVWPIAARAWIRDNRVRHLRTSLDGGRAPRGHASIEETVSRMSDSAAAAGAGLDQHEGDLFPFFQHCEYALTRLFGHN